MREKRTKEALRTAVGLLLALGITACGSDKTAPENAGDANDWSLSNFELDSPPIYREESIELMLLDEEGVVDANIYCKGGTLWLSSHVLQQARTKEASPVCSDGMATSDDWNKVVSTLEFQVPQGLQE